MSSSREKRRPTPRRRARSPRRRSRCSAVVLDVHVSASGFAIHKPRQPMKVPVDGESDELTFALFPVEEGEQVIEIEFFQGSMRVGFALLKTNVNSPFAEPRRASKPRLTGLMQAVEAEPDQSEDPAPPQSAGALQVIVPESPRGVGRNVLSEGIRKPPDPPCELVRTGKPAQLYALHGNARS